MKRRDFLKASTGLPLMVSAGASPVSLIQRASTPAPGILELGGQKQLFLDDWLIEEASRISRFMYRPQKYSENPIIEADRPWEMGLQSGYFTGVQIFGQAVIYDDEEEKIFKTCGAHSYRTSRLGDKNTLSIALATLPEDRYAVH